MGQPINLMKIHERIVHLELTKSDLYRSRSREIAEGVLVNELGIPGFGDGDDMGNQCVDIRITNGHFHPSNMFEETIAEIRRELAQLWEQKRKELAKLDGQSPWSWLNPMTAGYTPSYEKSLTSAE